MSVAEDLRAARALIDTPEKWCKHAGYVVEDGRVLSLRPTNGIPQRLRCASAWKAAQDALKVQTGGRYIYMWNDDPERTHADIMAAYDAAIANAEGNE